MLRIYNTLGHKVEEFKPIEPPQVKMYACGPTVYDFQHIGHMRRYVGDDILIRVLKFNGYDVKHVMNITDVGHLTSDADTGEDKMEKGAEEQKLSVWDLAKKFENQFFQSMDSLNIVRPKKIVHATDAIQDQIDLIKVLEEKGFTYKTSDGIYFDTSKLSDYGKLTGQNLDELKAGVRVDIKEKKNPTDFALWKFSPSDKIREMEWDSPFGIGFPGWHIECSAMSMKELGLTFDIHTGGIDHIPVHHTNEIAQSEAASGKPLANYWVHHAFLLVEGEKMSKSLKNFYTVQDVEEKGFDPLALRYLYLQTHYKQEMNFTWEALEGSQKALEGLYKASEVFGAYPQTEAESRSPSDKVMSRWNEFQEAVNDDLNTPKALAALHQGLSESSDDFDTLYLLEKTDSILGLKFAQKGKELYKKWEKESHGEVPEEVQKLVDEREELRKKRRFHLADQMRNKIKKLGWEVHDVEDSKTKVTRI